MAVITTDIHTFGNSLDLTASPDTTIIAPGVTVASDHGFGVDTLADQQTLINHGSIISTDRPTYAVVFDTTGSLVVNASDGAITGVSGMDLAAGDSVINFGSIWAGQIGIIFAGDVCSLDNRGTIYSAVVGLIDGSSGSTTTNAGTIEGLQYGLVVALASSGEFTTVNNSGVLRGGTDAIFELPGEQGGLHLQNSGTLIGGIDMTAATNDVIVNTGHISGAVTLGPGNDLFDGTGGTSGPIDGGLGENTLTGGLGKNQFIFDTALGATNFDVITNFRHHIDTIELSRSIFTALGPTGILGTAAFFEGVPAHEHAATRMIYDAANGFLLYDADGRGHAHAPIHFATLAAHLALTHTDFLVVA